MKRRQRVMVPVLGLVGGLLLVLTGTSVIAVEFLLDSTPYRGVGTLGLGYIIAGCILVLLSVSDLHGT